MCGTVPPRLETGSEDGHFPSSRVEVDVRGRVEGNPASVLDGSSPSRQGPEPLGPGDGPEAVKTKSTIGTWIVAGIAIVASFSAGCGHRAAVRTPAGGAEGTGSRFAFVFNPTPDNRAGRFAIYGTHPPDKRISLLKKGADTYCDAVTDSHGLYENDVISFPVTNLRDAGRCGSPGDYMVACFAPVANYANVNWRKTPDPKIAGSLDAAIRTSPALQSLRFKAQDIVAGDELSPLSTFSPRVHELDLSGRRAYLVSYESKDGPVNGPRFVVLDGTINALTGWCSYPYLRTFVLNDELYLESGSSCCGCGITIMELYKVTGNTVACVHADASESD